MPFFLDQFAHCKRLANHLKMGVILDPKSVTEENFRAAIMEVLSDKTYRNNAQRVKSLMTDKPVKSKELFLYWINYAIRHKGAHHLVSRVPFEMNRLQYWSLDVIGFLLGISLLLLGTVVKFVQLCCLHSLEGKMVKTKLQ